MASTLRFAVLAAPLLLVYACTSQTNGTGPSSSSTGSSTAGNGGHAPVTSSATGQQAMTSAGSG